MGQSLRRDSIERVPFRRISTRRRLPVGRAEVRPPLGERPPAVLTIPPRAVALTLSGVGVFLLASWLGYGGLKANVLYLGVISFFGLVFFALLFGLGLEAGEARAPGSARAPLGAFLKGEVGTASGPISGRGALVQMLCIPVALGLASLVFALIWSVVT